MFAKWLMLIAYLCSFLHMFNSIHFSKIHYRNYFNVFEKFCTFVRLSLKNHFILVLFFTSCQNFMIDDLFPLSLSFSRLLTLAQSPFDTIFNLTLDWGIGRNYNSWQNYFISLILIQNLRVSSWVMSWDEGERVS